MDMDKINVSVIVPCYLRPERTLRLIECFLNQDTDNFRVCFMGDCCPEFQKNIDSGLFASYKLKAENKGINFMFYNNKIHHGNWGAEMRNIALSWITDKDDSEFVMFVDNDDIIQPSHVSNYVNSIKDTDNDLVYSDSLISAMYDDGEPMEKTRKAKPEYGSIGFAEIIVRTSALKRIGDYNISPEYGHDWIFIQRIIKSCKFAKSIYPPTYIVKGLGDLRKDKID